MPYAVVDTTAIGNNKKMVVVPETWVISKNDRIGFVYWPNEPCEKKMKELIADDRRPPSPQWEKHLCKIIFRNIPSQTSAEKALAIWQKQFNTGAKRATPAMRSTPVAAPSSNTTTAQNKDLLKELNAPKLPTKPSLKPFNRRNDVFGGFFTVISREKHGGESHSYQSTPLNTEALPPQLHNLLNDLKREIISNQEEMMLKMQEGFRDMQQLFASLIQTNEKIDLSSEGKSMKTPDVAFKFQKLKTINDVKQFEAQLASANFRKKVHNWIDSVIWHENVAAKRMKTMVERMFDHKLLSQFSWFGMYNKEPLKQYFNVRKLLEYIITTPLHPSNQDEVKYLFLTMMNSGVTKTGSTKQNSADSLTNDKEEITAPTERTSAERENVAEQNDIVDENGTIDLDIIGWHRMEDGEAMEFEEIIEHEEIIQPEEELIGKDKSELENEQPAQKTDESLTEFHIKRITCLEELNKFENELSDPEKQRKVHKWIDSAVVNRETDVEKRLITLLDRLMDSKVLQSLSWMNAKSAKRPLQECKNFVRLFEYASRTVIHQTIIYNHRFVINFFAKRIEES